MGKRKEIKFLCKDGQTREGRQDGVMFWIRKDQKREQVGLPAFYVAANDIKGKGRTIYTAGHEYFTLEGAKELCQQIMAGEANLAERKSQIRGGGRRKGASGRRGSNRTGQEFPGQTGGCRDLFRGIAGVGGRNGRPKFNGPQYPAGLGEWGGFSA